VEEEFLQTSSKLVLENLQEKPQNIQMVLMGPGKTVNYLCFALLSALLDPFSQRSIKIKLLAYNS
jgi:hypothetical protein